MFSHLRERVGPIGCAIAPDTIRFAQIRSRRRLPTAVRITEAPLSPAVTGDAAQLSQAYRQAIDEGGFRGREVVVSLPPEQTIYRQLRLAPMPMTEVAAAVHWQMAREMEWQLGDFTSAFYEIDDPLAPVGHGYEVIAVATLLKHIHSHVDLIRSAGMVPIAVDAAPGALSRVFDRLGEADNEASPLLLLDVGEQVSTLAVVHHGLPVFIRSITFDRRKLGEPTSSEREPATDRTLSAGGGRPSPAVVGCAADVAHEITLCLHSLGAVQPCLGYGLGLGLEADAFLAALSERSGITFRDGAAAFRLVGCSMRIEQPTGEVGGNSLLPLGLALYGHSTASVGAAA